MPPITRKPKVWTPLTLACVDGCGRSAVLSADEHQDLVWFLATGLILPSLRKFGGRFGSGTFGPGWRCQACDEKALATFLTTPSATPIEKV